MTKQRVRTQTAHRITIHEARIQQAISRITDRQKAVLAEALRLRDLVSRAVGHLPERSLPAL